MFIRLIANGLTSSQCKRWHD